MIDVLNSVFLFFDMSPKRQKFLEKVLTTYACSSRVQKLKGLCKTRWVERHTCYEVFADLYKYIVIVFEAILDPRDYEEIYTKNVEVAKDAAEAEGEDDADAEPENWKSDRETHTKAQGMLACLKTPRHIVSFCVAKNALKVVKVLATKLQKRRGLQPYR